MATEVSAFEVVARYPLDGPVHTVPWAELRGAAAGHELDKGEHWGWGPGPGQAPERRPVEGARIPDPWQDVGRQGASGENAKQYTRTAELEVWEGIEMVFGYEHIVHRGRRSPRYI